MTTPTPDRRPTREECIEEGAPHLARVFDAIYGVGCWRAPEPGETVAAETRVAS